MRTPRRWFEETPRVATEQTVIAVRWLATRRQFTLNDIPYGVTGLPIFYYGGTGWNYGARVQLTDYRRLPYRYKVILHSLNSTRGRTDSYFHLEVPRISGTGFGVRLLLSDRQDIRARYYGKGNDSQYLKELLDPKSPLFKDENYYYYMLREPRFIFSLLRRIWGPINTSFSIGMESTAVSPRGRTSYYLDIGTPDGVTDGITGFVGAALNWDTRDDQVIPRQGSFQEWSYETARNSILSLFFEEIDYQRYTFTDARYFRLGSRGNLAQRTVFEVLQGSIPLYAYGEIGGQQRSKGLGGSDNLRGYDTQRFVDNVRFFTNTELRCHLTDLKRYRQHLQFHGILFLDTGRVWPELEALTLRDLYYTLGVGLRIYWNDEFVIRLEIGFSPEQTFTPIKYQNLF